jgi:protein transport protein SEC24
MDYDAQTAAAQAKKKRAYAAQAYEFGGNAAGQQQQQQPQQLSPQPAYGGAAPAYGQPMPIQPMGTPQMASPQAPGADLSQQFGQMNIQAQPQAPAQAAAPHLNQLFPSDLISQPFQVSELDLPPPPINLPPNTSVTPSPYANCPPKYVRSTLNTVPTTHSLLKKSRLPFALVISPYTSLHDNEDPVSRCWTWHFGQPLANRNFLGPRLHRSSHFAVSAMQILH